MAPLVIVGTGLAGYTLAREWRKLDSARSLVLISQDDGSSYSKPLLSNALAKNKTPADLAMVSSTGMAEQLQAVIRTGVSVVSIDRAQQQLVLSDGSAQPYSQLVLALGAEVFRLPLAGDAAERVLTVNDLADYAVFREALGTTPRRVGLIGGGLIGCEFANDLAAAGHQVTVMEPQGRPLPTLLPEASSAAVADGLASLGVVFQPLGVTAVNAAGDALDVTLSNGSTVTVDVVLSAVGLRPRVALAQAAGLSVGRGIQTNRLLATSDPAIFALGDCAEVDGWVLMYVLPLMAAARALAKTLTGTATPVAYPPMPVQIKTPVCPVVVSPVAAGAAGQWSVSGEGRNTSAAYRDDQGRLLGFALTGTCAADMGLRTQLVRELSPLLA